MNGWVMAGSFGLPVLTGWVAAEVKSCRHRRRVVANWNAQIAAMKKRDGW
jgi:hypothetical protein